MAATGLMENAFQIAYVTSDLDRAMEIMRRDYGWGEFLVLRDMPDALTHMALAYSGDMMIELMQPVAASGDFYSDHLDGAAGFTMRHHHFGYLRDSREAMAERRAAHVALGHGIVLEGETPGAVQYLYVDCRATIGHFLEYVRLDEGGREMFAAIPGSRFS